MGNVRRSLGAIIVLVLLAGASPAWAAPPLQEAGTIAYGETVNGEITDRQFEQLWTFEAEAGDVISVSVASAPDVYFDSYLIIEDSEGEIIAEVDDVFGADAFYVGTLETGGTHTIIVTRYGGRTGSSTGAYALTLERAATMWGTPVTLAIATEDQQWAYTAFAVDAPQAVSLAYEVVSGDLRPGLSVGYFETEYYYSFTELITVGGKGVTSAALTVELPVAGIYLIKIERPYWDWEYPAGEFTVTVTPAAQ